MRLGVTKEKGRRLGCLGVKIRDTDWDLWNGEGMYRGWERPGVGWRDACGRVDERWLQGVAYRCVYRRLKKRRFVALKGYVRRESLAKPPLPAWPARLSPLFCVAPPHSSSKLPNGTVAFPNPPSSSSAF